MIHVTAKKVPKKSPVLEAQGFKRDFYLMISLNPR